MGGRVKRLAGLAIAARRQEPVEPSTCALCERPLGVRTERHHVVPRSEGGHVTVPLHPICHRAIHAVLANADLAQIGTIEGVRARPEVARFLRWIRSKPADFHAPTYRAA